MRLNRAVWLVLDLRAHKRGAIETQLLFLVRRLRARQVRVVLVFADEPAPLLRAAFLAAGAEVRTLEFRRQLAALARLSGWLRAERPAICHFHFVRAHSPLVAAARHAGATVVVHDHFPLRRAGGLPITVKRLRAQALNWMVGRRLAVSRYVAESVVDIEHVARERVTVLPHGLDLERFRLATGAGVRAALGVGDRPLVACVARLTAEKGVETLIDAFARLPKRAVLALAGSGPLGPALLQRARLLGVADRLRLLGVRDDVEELYAAADVVAVPTHIEEAFGLAAAEAMAAGCPVVATDAGALPEVVGEGGLIVARRDPSALAEALGRVIEDDALAARLGEAGRARAEAEFAIDGFLEELLLVYDKVQVVG